MTTNTATTASFSGSPQAQTQAHLAVLAPEVRQRSDAYTEGGYWLLLWGLIVAAMVTWIIIKLGWLGRVAAAVNGKRPRPALATAAVAAVFVPLSWLVALPWDIYAEWWRPTQYGLSKQPLGDWLLQSVMGTGVALVLGVAALSGIYALLRASPKRWWLWGGVVSTLFIIFLMIIAPVLIEPLFNKYEPFPQGDVRDAIVKLAQESKVPTQNLLVYDGSRQRNVVTANVAGLFGTARIAVSDIAVQRATLSEVRAVVGHEIGHYVLGHAMQRALFTGVLMLLGFYVIHRLFAWFAKRLGHNAHNDITNPTGLPVLALVLSVVMTLATPLNNAMTRWGERQADDYSLQTARDPDGLASALVKTVEYRKASPGAVEEFLFHTHPSVENRVLNAMTWKAANTK